MILSGCASTRPTPRTNCSLNRCRPTIADLIKEYEEGNLRAATQEETIDLLECVELVHCPLAD
jgi:hypothetical protein